MSGQQDLKATVTTGDIIIDGRYRLLERLGEGGMGVVYKADDTRLGRRVALKLLRDLHDSDDYRARIYREARAASKLNHPYIATVHDYGTTPEGLPFIVMELVEGETLANLIDGSALTVERAVEITAHVAEALAEAHRRGIIHRDIKPSNVIVSDSRVKVLDFGLAKEIDPQEADDIDYADQGYLTRTASGVVIGTPLYLSPEQARGAPLDARSDLFALGSVLYECLTGCRAFAGGSVREVLHQIIHTDPLPPSKINPAVPPELDRITAQALAKDPVSRYQSATEFLAELQKFQSALQQFGAASTRRLPVSASASSRDRTLLKPRWSHARRLVPFVVLAVALLGLSFWFIFNYWRPGGGLSGSPEELRSWYDRGTRNLRDGAYFQASKALERAVAIDDSNALAHARLAEALMELDEMDRAQHEILLADEGRGALTYVDQLRLDAIKTTLMRNFPKAIEAYSDLKQRSPSEPGIYVDLGRAYEKNYEIDKAIESYEQATKLNSQEAAAFIRLGGLYGRKRESDKALAAFTKAESIYQGASNPEGQAEVFYQRGYFYDLASNYKEATANLQQSLKIARDSNNTYQQIRTLLQMSIVACFAGEPNQSQQYAAEAMGMAQNNGFDVLTAQALTGLGSAYHCIGRNSEAEKYFQQGLALARRHEARSTEAKSLLSLSSLQISEGRNEEGLSNVKQALSFYQQQGGDIIGVMRAQTLIGVASSNKGDYAVALDAFTSLLGRAKQLNDIDQISLSHEGLGNVMLLQERYPEALMAYQAGLTTDESAQDQSGIGYGSLNCGNTLWRLGRYAEADSMFARALKIAHNPDGYRDLLLDVQIDRIEENLSRRQFSKVVQIVEQVADMVEPRDRKSAVRTKKALALARLNLGDSATARTLSEEAVAKSVDLGDPALIYSARLGLAEVLVSTREGARALEIARADLSHFSGTNQQESLWHAYLIAARASDQLGDKVSARSYAVKGLEVFSGLERNWGEAFNKYATRPDVNDARSYLSRLTSQSGP